MTIPEQSEDEPTENADSSMLEPDGAELSAEAQMAQFEEALKDEDWGHQPC